MATAKIKTTKPRPPVTKVTLVLSKYEAEVLLRVLGNVGGDPTKPARTAADSMHNALSAAGITPAAAPYHGAIYFDA